MERVAPYRYWYGLGIRPTPPRLAVKEMLGVSVVAAVVLVAAASLRLYAGGPDWGLQLAAAGDGNGVVATAVRGHGVAWEQHVRAGDRVLSVDGADAQLYVGRDLGPVEQIVFADAQGVDRLARAPELTDSLKLWLFGVAVLFAALGAAVHRWSPDLWLGRIFLIFCGASALALAGMPGAIRGYAPANFLAASSATVASAAFTCVFLWFPRPLMGARWLSVGLATVSVGLLTPLVFLYGRGEGTPPLLESSLFVWLGGNLIAGTLLLAARAVRPANRHVLAPLALGIGLGIFPLAVLDALPQALGRQPIMWAESASASAAAIPLAFAYAILRHRLFALDARLRRLLVNVCSTIVSVAIFVAGWVALRALDVDDQLAALAAVASVTLAAPTVFDRTERVLEAWLYPSLRLARSERLAGRVAIASWIAHKFAARSRELVPTQWVALLVQEGAVDRDGPHWRVLGRDGDAPAAWRLGRDGDAPAAWRLGRDGDAPAAWRSDQPVPLSSTARRASSASPGQVSDASFVGEASFAGEASLAGEVSGATVVRVELSPGLVAAVGLGPRLDGTPLGGVDVETIRLLARSVLPEIEAALLRDRTAEEDRFRHGLSELARDLAAVGPVQDVMQVTARHAASLLCADSAVVWCRDSERGSSYVPYLATTSDRPIRRDLDSLLGPDLASRLNHYYAVRGRCSARVPSSGPPSSGMLADSAPPSGPPSSGMLADSAPPSGPPSSGVLADSATARCSSLSGMLADSAMACGLPSSGTLAGSAPAAGPSPSGMLAGSAAACGPSPDVGQASVLACWLGKPRVTEALLVLQRPQPFTDEDERRALEIAEHADGALRRAKIASQAAEAEALRELDRLRTELMSMVAHELRNPLTAVLGYAQMLRRRADTLTPAGVARMADQIERSAIVTRDIVRDLSTTSLHEVGRLAVCTENVEVGAALTAIAHSFQLLPGGDRVRTEVPRPVCARADPARLEQMVGNLLHNALRYAPTGPIVLRARAVGPAEVWIEVSDVGPGIPVELQPRIWDKFYRISGSERMTQGTGIGLAVVRTLAELHSGRAELDSSPGGGSTFRVVLPRVDA